MHAISEDFIGLQMVLRFVSAWWIVFAIAPLVVAPILTIVGVKFLNDKQHRKPSGRINRLEPSPPVAPAPSEAAGVKKRRRRSWVRRMFVDDRSYHRTRSLQIPQIFGSSLILSCVVSALLFIGIATFLVVKAMVAVNTESSSLE